MKLLRNFAFTALLLLLNFPMEAQKLPLDEKLERGSVLDIFISRENETAALLETWDGEKYLSIWSSSGDLLKTQPLKGNLFGLFKRDNQWLSILLPESSEIENSHPKETTSEKDRSEIFSETGAITNVITGEILMKLPPSQLLSRAVDYGKPQKGSDFVYHKDSQGRYMSVEYWLGKTTVKIDGKDYDSEFQLVDLESGKIIFSRLFLSDRDSFIPRGRFSPRITVSFSNDGKYVILAGTEQVTGLFSLETGERNAVFINPLDDAFFLFLNETKLLQYNHYSRKSKIFSMEGGLPEKTFNHGLRYPVITGKYIISIFDDGYQIFQSDGSDIKGVSFTYFKPLRSAFFFRQSIASENFLFPRAFSNNILEYRLISLPEEE